MRHGHERGEGLGCVLETVGNGVVDSRSTSTVLARSVYRVAARLLHKWGELMVLSLALAIIIIDSTLLNVSLSTLIHDLNTTLQKLQWVISAYSLVLAALTVTGGRM